jgi:hypothetical protein
MANVIRAVMVAALIIAVAVNADGDDASAIVGARVVTCAGCRLNRLPQLRAFLNNEARQYPALEIDYVQGADPVMQFLNKYKRVVTTVDIASMDGRQVQELMQRNNIHIWTPTPSFVPPEFTPTPHCRAWRQTGNCDPDGPRESLQDESCSTIVGSGRSGYCECIGRDRAPFVCEHTPFTCESICTESIEPDPQAAGEAPDDEF